MKITKWKSLFKEERLDINKIDELSPDEKFKVVNDYLQIRIASGVKVFRNEGTKALISFTKKINPKLVNKAVNFALIQRNKIKKDPFKQ